LNDTASLIVSFGAGNLNDPIAVKNDKQPPTAFVWLAPEDTQATVNFAIWSLESSHLMFVKTASQTPQTPQPAAAC
jgi:hypothetical protein